MRAFFTCGIILLLAAHPAAAAAEAHYAEQRAAMLRAIERDAIDTADYTGRRGFDARVMAEIGAVPRHLFVPADEASRAYANRPLPIGYGQTISQPYIVARMTEVLLAGGPLSSVLEVGTGSGYQTAILSQLVGRVFTVERIAAMLERAAERFRMLRLRNINYRHADGGMGWPERGPFDGILVTASPKQIPQELIDQLATGGRMVMPVGDGGTQELILVTKHDGRAETEVLEPVSFVPLKSGKV